MRKHNETSVVLEIHTHTHTHTHAHSLCESGNLLLLFENYSQVAVAINNVGRNVFLSGVINRFTTD
jgi:hypothetical protein